MLSTLFNHKKTLLLVFFSFLLFPFTIYGASESILIGLNVPLSGAYSKQGHDQLKAYLLAIDKINNQGGIKGQKIVYAVRDTQTNPEVAARNANELIDLGASLITGGSSSAVAIAQAEVCQKRKTLFMAGLSHSNATTGTKAHRYSFRWYNNGHQTAKAMATTLVDKFGADAKFAIIYADYTWGQTVKDSMEQVIRQNGGKILLSLATDLGESSFISTLLKVRRAKPDVFIIIHFGQDMVTSLMQTTQLKMRDNMAIVVPLMELHMAQPLGPEIIQNVITSMCWYHGLSEKYPGSKEFVEKFEQRYNKKPGNAAAAAWVNIHQYAEAVKTAKSFSAPDVIQALEGHKFTLLGKQEYWRAWDHQGIHPTYIGVGKTPEQSKNQWDLFEIISEHDGEKVARTRKENPVKLEPLD